MCASFTARARLVGIEMLQAAAWPPAQQPQAAGWALTGAAYRPAGPVAEPVGAAGLQQARASTGSAGGASLGSASGASAGEAASLSPLAHFSLAYSLSEVSLSASQTQFGYTRPDGGAALRVSKSLSVKASQETMRVSLAFSAEVLGLTAEDFAGLACRPAAAAAGPVEAAGGATTGSATGASTGSATGASTGSAGGFEPLRLRFSFRLEQTRTAFSSQTSVSKTVRKPEDLLNDLAQALGRIFRERGNKSIRVVLDEEAAQALLSDEKAREAFAMLIALMNLIEMQRQEGEIKRYLIRLSGKGRPVIEHSERLEVESHSLAVDVELTVYPPAGEKGAVPEV